MSVFRAILCVFAVLALCSAGCNQAESPLPLDFESGNWAGGFGLIDGDRLHWTHITATLRGGGQGLVGDGTYLVGPDSGQLPSREIEISGTVREQRIELTFAFGTRKLRCQATYGTEHIEGTCKARGEDLTLRLLRSEPPRPSDVAAIKAVYQFENERRVLVSQLGPMPILLDLPSGRVRALFFKGGGTWVAGPRLLVGHPESYRLAFADDAVTIQHEGGEPVLGKRRRPPTEEEFSFRSSHDGSALHGTLTLPRGEGPHPGIVWVHGSGHTPRGEAMFFPQYFADLGFAVLAFDKRGVGASEGSYAMPDGSTFSEPFLRRRGKDVASAMDALREHEQVDGKRVALTGISQAGWVMPVAASSTECSFTLSMAGGATPLSQEEYFSELTDELRSDASLLSIDEAIAKVRARAPRDHDWSTDFASQRCPGLWLYGLNDRSNPSQLAIEILEAVKQKAGRDFTILQFPSGNHPLMQSRTGGNSERLVVSQFVPEMFTAIEKWLVDEGVMP